MQENRTIVVSTGKTDTFTGKTVSLTGKLFGTLLPGGIFEAAKCG